MSSVSSIVANFIQLTMFVVPIAWITVIAMDAIKSDARLVSVLDKYYLGRQFTYRVGVNLFVVRRSRTDLITPQFREE